MLRIPHLFALIALPLAACSNMPSQKNSKAGEAESVEVQPIQNPGFPAIAAAGSSKAKDRAAILAMQGEYAVDFNFRETVILDENYHYHPAKTSGAHETVIVVKNQPDHIVLQHLLIVGDGHVIKHWRQDWHYEARERFEFIANQHWQIAPIAEEKIDAHWTQCVYEVSDAPRYCGTGRWNHRYGVSTWTSDRTWRPLPRRDYTIREDYNALNVENRHTVTPLGWTHEQDNTKVVRDGRETANTLVREFGFNDYRSIAGFDFSPAYAYWDKTADYWQRVRQTWRQQFKENKEVVLLTDIDGLPIITATFEQASAITDEHAEVSQQSIQQIFKEWVRP